MRIATTSDPIAPNQISAYFHCAKCLQELPRGTMSPMEWSKLSIGLSADGTTFQVWCNRHNENVMLVTLVEDDPEVEDDSGGN